jgi:hypothetical protein
MVDFGWDFPPGVSGNEREIAGDNEILITVQCTDQGGVDCPFSGEVEASEWGGVAFWTCPLCDEEYEETLETERDPDDRPEEDLYPHDYDYGLDETW